MTMAVISPKSGKRIVVTVTKGGMASRETFNHTNLAGMIEFMDSRGVDSVLFAIEMDYPEEYGLTPDDIQEIELNMTKPVEQTPF